MTVDDLFPAEAAKAQLRAEIECVRREITMRERVYQRWVDNGKMTRMTKDREIELMKAVLARLEGL